MKTVIENLLYTIKLKSNLNKYLTVRGELQNFNRKIGVSDWENNNYQINPSMQTWQFKYNNGRIAYKIMCLEYSSLGGINNGKVITYIRDNASYNLVLSDDKDEDEQYWLPIQLEDKNYIFANYADNTLVLTLKNCDESIETSVLCLEKLQDVNLPGRIYQEFSVESLNMFSKQTRVLEDGVYFLYTSLTENMVIDRNKTTTNIALYSYHGGENQRWKFIYSTQYKAYKIIPMDNQGLSMVWNLGNNNVHTLLDANEDHLFWIVEMCGENEYIIKNKKNPNMILSVENDGLINNTNILVEESKNALRQKFRFVKTI